MLYAAHLELAEQLSAAEKVIHDKAVALETATEDAQRAEEATRAALMQGMRDAHEAALAAVQAERERLASALAEAAAEAERAVLHRADVCKQLVSNLAQRLRACCRHLGGARRWTQLQTGTCAPKRQARWWFSLWGVRTRSTLLR